MSQQHFDFSTRPLVPLAHDYLHGASEPWHHHACAQPLPLPVSVSERS